LTNTASKSEKAISPILATLLLIVIAVAAIVVTYAWVMTYLTSTTNQAGIFLKEDTVNWQTGKMVIYVRNTGTADATIDAVYVGTSGNLTLQTGVIYAPSSKIVAKNGGTIAITVSCNWTSKTTYSFRITPVVGNPLSFEEAPP
jgi:flagellin-like protein